MNGVNQLGYLIIGVSDLEGWRGLSSSVLGLELVPGDSRSTTYLRMDEHHHRIELRYGGSELRPGSGGEPFAMGPLTLSTTSADLPIRYVDPAQAHSLCGRKLDWIEAVQG